MLAGAPLNTLLILLIGETHEAPSLIGEGLPCKRKSHESNDQYLRSHPAKDRNICLVFGLMAVPVSPLPCTSQTQLVPLWRSELGMYVCVRARMQCVISSQSGGEKKDEEKDRYFVLGGRR